MNNGGGCDEQVDSFFRSIFVGLTYTGDVIGNFRRERFKRHKERNKLWRTSFGSWKTENSPQFPCSFVKVEIESSLLVCYL